MTNECSICFHELNDDLFTLTCCKNIVHHNCLIGWINSSIDTNNSDFNKCIICKSYNWVIEDFYNNLKYISLNNSPDISNNINSHIDDIESVSESNDNQLIVVHSSNLTNNKFRILKKFIIISFHISVVFVILFIIVEYH